jgi:hypothetical protein
MVSGPTFLQGLRVQQSILKKFHTYERRPERTYINSITANIVPTRTTVVTKNHSFQKSGITRHSLMKLPFGPLHSSISGVHGWILQPIPKNMKHTPMQMSCKKSWRTKIPAERAMAIRTTPKKRNNPTP